MMCTRARSVSQHLSVLFVTRVTNYLVQKMIQDDGSWAEAAAVALATAGEVSSGGQEARLEQLLQRTRR